MIRFGRTTDRPVGRPVGKRTATLQMSLSLSDWFSVAAQRGAATRRRRRRRRYGCGSLRIHETVETRLCSSFRRTDAILDIKLIATILLRRSLWRDATRKRNEIAIRLRVQIIAIHFFNYMTNLFAIDAIRNRAINATFREWEETNGWIDLPSFRATRETVKNNAMMNLTERDIMRDTDGN